MKITNEDVKQVALLSRLDIAEDQIETFASQLSAILDYAESLSSLDTADTPPMAHVLPIQNVMRADEVKPSLARELAQQNAPEPEDGYFRVPKVVEG
ncbi:MAG: Asp-tRNA(Asn)/Glu-tRNA(Gln) amidotransferase subunit GatC [Sporomusaceae bacterium]|nr:Asp-tRNA(Asn)/Glu-tRNA(Gln) amidotransferase subunit GatC [Sporomusaceae bacterium]